MFKLVLEKAEEPQIKLSTSAGSWKKQKSSRKPPISALLTMPNLWLCRSHKLWKILKEMGIPDHLTCLLRNLFAGKEKTVRTGQGTTDWFQIGKGVHQGCMLSLGLFNFYAEYIMWNAGLDDAQAVIKIAGRNINNLRYADDTTCRGPAWGFPPMTRSFGRKPDKTQRRDQASGVPPGISWASTPQDQSLPALLCYAFHLLISH